MMATFGPKIIKKGGASFHFVLPFKQLPDIEELDNYCESPSNTDH
ncbi:Uncharacterised protein [Providencia stuartii]|nr:Uncharacterised protein [Providencia stuartii]